MQEELGNLVHPVLAWGLNLKERLDRGQAPPLEAEQSVLKRLLLSDSEAARLADFGGDADRDALAFAREQAARGETTETTEFFLGTRYALACWLDELFILHSRWEAAWNERKLEVSLYGSNDRAWKFWQQAELAELRSTPDALEVFYLCVMLGFRGELHENPDKLRAWTKSAQVRLSRLSEDLPQPPELGAPTNVPPLHGRERFRRMVYVAGVVMLLLIPLIAFIVVQQLGE